jgi:nicotinate-nucleotide pyrophosphorylase (carboxylating)
VEKKPWYISEKALEELIDRAIEEDVGDGDHTTLASIPADAEKRARLVMKEAGVIAGINLAEKIFWKIGPRLQIDKFVEDGDQVKKGDTVLTVSGNARSILTAERLALNFMQRMSGIATYCHRLIGLLQETGTKILDTRKTTPGFRIIEKWAVKIGGGENHRFGLYDMILLKDNHIDFAGGIEKAIAAAKKYLEEQGKQLKIEVETRSLQEVHEAVQAGGIDVVMLDNMDLNTMKEAVKIIGGKYKTEASGGITESNIRDIALCGVDYISIGALTHSVKSLDMSLMAY